MTLWSTTSDWWSPKFRYARRYISRSASESSRCVVPAWGMHVPPPHASPYDATVRLDAGENVELAGVVQSTWNFQVTRLLVVPSATR